MACPLEKLKKQGEMPLPIFSPIPSLNLHYMNWLGLRMGSTICCCVLASFRGGERQAIRSLL